ncbi:hypothetical protein OH76DRAFT_1412693 [Lentinus brumalis]|uniref:Uncharacterized protein n=1 Tax=Lentinus brumalis TaxID=2498619 RepID=A0A371CKL6_9APHY|nr:hypothetical protein OH76DRAFT_1412693 [Polyporus brumalis]
MPSPPKPCELGGAAAAAAPTSSATPATQTTSTSLAPHSIPAAFSTATSTGDRLPFELRSILCQGTRARPHLYQPRGGSVPPVNA